MAGLGTLTAQLKLEGAAGMMSGLRAAGGAVSSLGNVLGGIRAPLAQVDGALRAVQNTGASTSAAVAPLHAASAAIRQLPVQTGRAAAALQTLTKAGAGLLGVFARSRALDNLPEMGGRLPMVGRALRLPGPAHSAAGGAPARQTGSGPGQRRVGEAPRVNLGTMPRLSQTRSGAPVGGLVLGGIPSAARRGRGDALGGIPSAARRGRGDALGGVPRMTAGGDFARGRRGGPASTDAGGRLAALLAQLQAASGRSRTTTSNAGAQMGAVASRVGEGDRLARIGGFIGGGGGPALDFYRRTAAATEKTAAGIQTLLQRLPGAEKTFTALWA